MDRIAAKVFSHICIPPGKVHKTYVREVFEGRGLTVGNYSDLVHHVAEIGYRNPRYSLFFRGQEEDWKAEIKDKDSGVSKRSSIVASIFRDKNSTFATDQNMKSRIRVLKYASRKVRSIKQVRDRRLLLYPEMQWSILQHYGIISTPLIDITQSLRVASSFATMEGSGFVYVFGLPALHGSISYFVEENMVVVRLQSACPPMARRPHFQEGYLVGHFPTDEYKHRRVHIAKTLNLSNRMLAKFFIPDKKVFWKKGFKSIPMSELFPANDPMDKCLEVIRQRLRKKFPDLAEHS